jgi:hypothetical protein
MAFEKQVCKCGGAGAAVARRYEYNGKLRHLVDAMQRENCLKAR